MFFPPEKRIYLSPPDLGESERQFLLDAFDSNWITTLGPEVDAFEKEISSSLDIPYALALSSGTAAIHLALINLGVGPRDVVLCSDLTFAASANPIVYCGARPVFVDSERESWNMDPALLAEALEDLTSQGMHVRAAVVVDLYGRPADFDQITAVCEQYEVPVVEDAAEALGAFWQGKPCGAHGVMGALSFNGNKIITTSGGGMLLSSKREFIDRARHLATQARDPFPFYHHTRVGYNYRLSNLLAAIGRAQLRSLDEKVERRRAINKRYKEQLADLPGIEFMPEDPKGKANCWLTTLTIDPKEFGATNNELRLFLESENIESRYVWKPMHLQPVFSECPIYGGAISEELFLRGLCLPSGSSLSDADQDRICNLIREFHKQKSYSYVSSVSRFFFHPSAPTR